MGIVYPLASVRRFRLISPELAHFRDAEPPCYRHSIAEGRRLSLLNCEQGQYKCRVGNMIPVAVRMGTERRRRAQTAELGCGRPLPRSPRVPCDPPGCGSGWWLRLRACRGCCLVAAAQRGGSSPCSRGRFFAVPSERLLISSFIWDLRDGRSPLFHCSAAPCWQPRRVDAGVIDAISLAADAATAKYGKTKRHGKTDLPL